MVSQLVTVQVHTLQRPQHLALRVGPGCSAVDPVTHLESERGLQSFSGVFAIAGTDVKVVPKGFIWHCFLNRYSFSLPSVLVSLALINHSSALQAQD